MSDPVLTLSDNERITRAVDVFKTKCEVYKATYLGQVVAIKVYPLPPPTHLSDRQDYFSRHFRQRRIGDVPFTERPAAEELAALQTLSSEHLAGFLGTFPVTLTSGVEPITLFFEYGIGGTLENALKTSSICERMLGLSLIHQMASGIAYLHSMKRVHGNLKPSNVIFKDKARRQVMLTDYCLPDNYLNDELMPRLCQIKDEPKSYASDVYSLGAVARLVINNETPRRQPSIEQLEWEFPIQKLKSDYPDCYKAIYSALFRKVDSRPTADEFKGSFEL